MLFEILYAIWNSLCFFFYKLPAHALCPFYHWNTGLFWHRFTTKLRGRTEISHVTFAPTHMYHYHHHSTDWLFFFFLTRNETSLKLDKPSKSIVNLRVSSWCVHFMKKKVKVLVTQSCPTLRHPMDGSTPGSSVHRLLQARLLEWAAILCSGGSSRPRDSTWISCFAGRFFTI